MVDAPIAPDEQWFQRPFGHSLFVSSVYSGQLLFYYLYKVSFFILDHALSRLPKNSETDKLIHQVAAMTTYIPSLTIPSGIFLNPAASILLPVALGTAVGFSVRRTYHSLPPF